MHNSFSEPGVYGTEPEMVPWKTYDSYDEDFVAKVSTLDYFEQVSSYPAPLDDELTTVQYVDVARHPFKTIQNHSKPIHFLKFLSCEGTRDRVASGDSLDLRSV